MTFQETSEASARLGARIEKAGRILGILLSGLVIVYAYAVVTAPVDAVQGVIQKTQIGFTGAVLFGHGLPIP